jgi:hypothetical protein
MLEAKKANPPPAAALSKLTDKELNQFAAASVAADAEWVRESAGAEG